MFSVENPATAFEIRIVLMSTVFYVGESFVPDLKKNPRLAYRKFRNRVFFETRSSCNEITENYGLLYFLLPLADWLALPGNSGTAADGTIINIAGYDIDQVLYVGEYSIHQGRIPT